MHRLLRAGFVAVAAMATAVSGRSLLAGPPVLVEEFEGASLPAGWTVLDDAGQGAVWTVDSDRPNETGGTGGFAIADSDDAGFVDVDTTLVTPVLNLTGMTSVYLRFRTSFKVFDDPSDLADEIGDVDLSTNGGASWTNVWRHEEADGDLTDQTVYLPLPAADNQSDVRVRFRYYDAYFDYWWEVDNVRVETDPIFQDDFEN
jgi:hypothetical protein